MLTPVTLVDAPGRPLLLLGPSLGTSVETLWGRCARLLRGDFHVVGWELPGHGEGTPASAGFGVAGLAKAVLDLVDRVRPGAVFRYAGDSVGGAVGLQLLLDAPHRVESAVLLCTAAKIGESGGWRQRAETVRAEGTQAVVAGSIQRWFGPGFVTREPDAAEALLDVLRGADPESYAKICEALASFDVRARLGRITAPVLAVAGSDDQPTPPEGLEAIATQVRDGRFVVLDGVAHLAPAEQPERVAELLDEHFRTEEGERTIGQTRDAGMAVRRAVLGDAHVDRAVAGTTPFTRDFQELITAYAWGRSGPARAWTAAVARSSR
ncbi:alpha/beta fold hydrolase [Paractinoplanes durhamensis]